MRHGNPTLLPKLPPRRSQCEGSSVLGLGCGSWVCPRSSAFLWTGPRDAPTPSWWACWLLFNPQSVAQWIPPAFQSLPYTVSKIIFIYLKCFVYTSGYFISDPPKLPSKVSENPFSHWALIVQENFHIIYAGKHRKNPHGPANTETVIELNLGGSGGM